MSAFIHSVSLIFNRLGTMVFLPSMVILVTVDVLLRYVFNSPIWGSKEINGLFLILLFFFCLSYCLDENRHVRVEIVYGRLGRRSKSLVDILVALSVMFFSSLLAYHHSIDLPYVIRTGESGEELGTPYWPIKVMIILCTTLFFLNGFSRLIRAVRDMLKGDVK